MAASKTAYMRLFCPVPGRNPNLEERQENPSSRVEVLKLYRGNYQLAGGTL